MTLTNDFNANVRALDTVLRMDASFDLVGRGMSIGGKRAKLYFVDGLTKDESMVKIMSDLLVLEEQAVQKATNAREFADSFLPYGETDVTDDVDSLITFILSGAAVLLIDGYSGAIQIDTRTYPVRSVEEPENNRVLMGPHEGFVETLVFNTALLRRRIRDPSLTVELHQVGSKTKLDVVLCYLDDRVDKKLVKRVASKLDRIKANTLCMGQESILECLVPGCYLNPFPRVRYTERPDAAAASVAEGSIVLICDNSPAAMIIPTSIFDFMQDTNDYYFPPLIGTFLRAVRLTVFSLTLVLIPVWYLLISNPSYVPPWLEFILIEEPNGVPVIAQLLIVELVVDALKIASLNTPKSLSNSFSVIGALVLGEFAVNAQWLVAEVVLYMAFVAVANFAQPSFELGYSFKLSRVFILILTALFNLWGFIAGFVTVLLLITLTRTVAGRGYLYPLIPFNKKAFASLLLRKPINKYNN